MYSRGHLAKMWKPAAMCRWLYIYKPDIVAQPQIKAELSWLQVWISLASLQIWIRFLPLKQTSLASAPFLCVKKSRPWVLFCFALGYPYSINIRISSHLTTFWRKRALLIMKWSPFLMDIFWWIKPKSKSTTSAQSIKKAMLDIPLL